MKVLVTGSTGFIGGYVVNELLKTGHDIITSSSSEATAKQKEWYGETFHIPLNFDDLVDAENYFRYFNEPDTMIHLAWEGLPNYKSGFHETVNLPRHFAFLSNMVSNGLNDLTVTGTCFEYGMQEGALREDMDVHPSNPYGRAKNELRRKLEVLRKSLSFSFKWIRLFYMYGQGQNPNSLLSQLEKAIERGDEYFNMSGGEQVRDYLPVEKVAENIVRIALQSKVTGVINNCSGIPMTVNTLVEDFLKNKKSGIRLNRGYFPYPDFEPMRFWGNTDKLKKITENE